ncbi:MAG: serine/threonine-protein kinase [Phycisphaerales bacterium]
MSNDQGTDPNRIELADDGEPQPFSAPSTPAANPNEASRSGSSLDTVLGKLVVERGLMSPDELDDCTSLVRKQSSTSVPVTLAEVLVSREFLTKRQVERLRGDLEAVKTSQQILGYRIIRKLGAGAMATVFLAKQLSLDRLVAIKVLPKKYSTNANFIERFYKEGRAAAKLNHNNIVAAYDVGQSGEHHYFVMEYVDGDTVYDRIVARKRLPEREALEIIRQIASALQHAHEMGFVHRDIKPKNIMMTTAGVAKLADLGLARGITDKEAAEAESGRAFGTPYYISPEQIRGAVDIGPPADIYGLGATFYHMVTGRVPFEGTSPSQVMHKHLKQALTPPDHLNPQISNGTALIIETMMKKDARARYQSARELLADIDLVLAGKDPEYARPDIDVTAIATTVVAAAGSEVTVVRKDQQGPFSSPAVIALVAFAALSFIGNLVLLVALFSK